MFKAPSLARLRQYFPMLADERLSAIREAIQNNRKMVRIDVLLENHGVEYIRNASGAAIAAYSNSGDIYAPTIIRDYASGNYRLTTVSDYVEVYERRNGRLP
jgi:hypothetical protein